MINQFNAAFKASAAFFAQKRISKEELKPIEAIGFSNLPLPSLLSALGSSITGLSSTEATKRLATYGPNVIATHGSTSVLFAFLARFRNPLVLILIAAAGISALTGDVASFVIISIIVLMSVVLDVVQEQRAENAAEALREQVSLTANVFRDGHASEVPASELVPGDVISLSAGDLIPADSRLIEARDLYVNEALLTGEPYPAEKTAITDAAGEAQTTLLPHHLIFMGSSVVSGTAKALIVATGINAQLGSIAGSLQKAPPPTAFATGVRDFGVMIVKITIFLILFTLLINLAFHRPPLESFLFALALAVGLTPELLPMVISVTLAHGALRMAKKQVIVKRLTAIHDLGSMDVLCSDKTGTLTDAHIKLVREVDLSGHDSNVVMQMAMLNAAFETGLKSPLDEAILAAKAADLSGWTKIDEVPFDFERRRVSVLLERGGQRLLVVKGAPEDILRLASHYTIDGAPSLPLDAAAREKAEQTFNALGREGYRVLGVASRDVESDRVHACVDDESRLTFVGFLAFLDPPKAGAKTAVAELAALGVTVKVVTGDNEHVTRHVCHELGLLINGTLTGPQIEKLNDEALGARLEDTTLFCRVTPQQKSRIIMAFRNRGHVVGYLGDGINDAPSLHAADVGFSVDTAVDVAKEAASMILLRKDLSVLAEGVREGRRTYANILKYVMMGTSSNFGNMFSMAGGVLILPFLPMLPIQILLNNLLYDISETTIPLDYVDESMVAKPRRWNIKTVRKFMFVVGPLSSIFDFVTFWLLLHFFKAGEALFHTAWFVESMATQVLVIFIIRTAQPFRNLPHPVLVFSSLAATCLAVLIPFTPFGTWFGFVPLPATLLGALGITTLAYLCLVYTVRRWFFREMA